MKKTTLALCALTVTAPLLVTGARAQTLGNIRESIRRYWGQNQSQREEARAARSRASQSKGNAGDAHSQLQKAGQVFLQANEVFLDIRQQVKRTEANIVRTRHQVQLVQKRYDRHKKLFGARLASMQQNGQIGYLNILLGSRTLSDLSRRAYLFQTIAAHDSDLQSKIKNDRLELEEQQNRYMAEWQKRNSLQQDAMRERSRVVRAQQEQLTRWKSLQRSVYADLAFSDSRSASAKRARAAIYQLEAERDRIEDQYENQRRRYSSPRRYRSRRGNRGYRSYRRYRTRRYQTVRITRRVQTQRYVPVGGVLKPMPIEKLETRAVKVPVENRGGVLSEDYVVEDAPN